MIARGGRAAVAFVSLCVIPALLLSPYLSIALAGLALVFVFMFRDPNRDVGQGIVSPADGTVREVDHANGYLSIYLALRNVHVTRAPMDGTVKRAAHVMGRHVPAFTKKSVENERLEITMGTKNGPASMIEMAGIIARRIVPYIEEGQTLRKGDRISLIRFGSRVDLRLPPSEMSITVRRGDKLRAGETKIAEVLRGGME
ncbi:MAG: phosphatidylserine decarboxylase [Candidatus Thermoplasmatota archaeon]|nr:phosphatidylserine decarboxylase [Candidatus Thermoplasmatota archaeon]